MVTFTLPHGRARILALDTVRGDAAVATGALHAGQGSVLCRFCKSVGFLMSLFDRSRRNARSSFGNLGRNLPRTYTIPCSHISIGGGGRSATRTAAGCHLSAHGI